MPIIDNFPKGGSGGGGGLALAAVSNIQTVVASGKVYIKWKDPDDMVVAGSTLATWGGTLLIRKAGSAPVSRRDGVVVVDSKTRNAYQTDYFCDSGLTDGVQYFYKFYPYTTGNAYTDSSDDEFNATPVAIAPGNVTNKSAQAAGNGKLAVKWSDPALNIQTDGVTVSTWAGTKIVYKEGSAPTGPEDGTLALNSTTRNAYETTPLVITGLTNGTTYHIGFFPYSTDGAVNTNAVNRITGVPNRLVLSAVPEQSGAPTYDGDPKNPSWNDAYDSNKMTLGGETVGTDAGDYTATFTPTDDYVWSGDATPLPKNVTWTINQATGTVSTNPATIPELNKTTTYTQFSITGTFDGTYTVESEDTSIATVSLVAGKTYRVSCVNNTTGTTNIKITCSGGSNYTNPAVLRVPVTCKFVTIYGAEWQGTSDTALTRTDASQLFTDPVPAVNNGNGSSPFDTLQPWAGIEKVNDSEAGVLVKIPKFYYKLSKNGDKLKIQVADGQADGFYVSPAHADRGDGKGERDFVYVGRYHCHNSNWKSQTGGTPKVNITRSDARTGISNLGATIWQSDFAMRMTIWLLYIVEFANWDSQSKIGGGCSQTTATSSAVFNMGGTDSMTYHTGTVSASHSDYGECQYRWIEGLWSNCYDWCDGCYYNASGLNIIMKPSDFSDTANGTLVGLPTAGYPSKLGVATALNLQWFYPTESSGSDSTYVPDYWNFNAGNPCLRVGGSYGQGLGRGLFCVVSNGVSSRSANFGARLQKLP